MLVHIFSMHLRSWQRWAAAALGCRHCAALMPQPCMRAHRHGALIFFTSVTFPCPEARYFYRNETMVSTSLSPKRLAGFAPLPAPAAHKSLLPKPWALTEGRDGAAPAPPPAVGWLWDKKAADTRKILQQNNLRPKK